MTNKDAARASTLSIRIAKSREVVDVLYRLIEQEQRFILEESAELRELSRKYNLDTKETP